jgi:hypothetical protein
MPLLVHASGNHERLSRAFFGEANAQTPTTTRPAPSSRAARSAAARAALQAARDAAAARWRALFAPQGADGLAVLYRHPVLLVDSAAAGGRVCALSDLRTLQAGHEAGRPPVQAPSA